MSPDDARRFIQGTLSALLTLLLTVLEIVNHLIEDCLFRSHVIHEGHEPSHCELRKQAKVFPLGLNLSNFPFSYVCHNVMILPPDLGLRVDHFTVPFAPTINQLQ